MGAQGTDTHRPVYILTSWYNDRTERKKQNRPRNTDQRAKPGRKSRAGEQRGKSWDTPPQKKRTGRNVCGVGRKRVRQVEAAIIDSKKARVNTKIRLEEKKET